MPLDAQMPPWLGARADWETKNVSDALESFLPFMEYMQGKETRLQLEQMKTNLATGILNQQAKGLDIKQQQMEIADKAQGMKEYPEWLRQTGGDWQKVLDTPFTGTSQSGSEMAQRVQQAAWQKSVQQQALDIKQQGVQNQLDIAKTKADLQAKKNDIWANIEDRLATVQEQKAAAVKAGKTSEFEAIQSDWSDTITKINSTDDPAALSLLMARKQQDEDRMKKLSTFASQVPSVETDTTVKSPDGNKSVTQKTKGPLNPTVTDNTPKAVGGYKIGTIYKGGLKYLGGDPNSQDSWEQSK
jgi:DNA polymerase III alpha subunit (gram-positive type)